MDALNTSTPPAPAPTKPASAPAESAPEIDLRQIDVSQFGFTPPVSTPKPSGTAPGPEAPDFSSLGTVPPPLVTASANITAAGSRSLTWQVAAQVTPPPPPEPIDISQLDLSQFGFNPEPAPTPTPAPVEPVDISQLDLSQFGFNPTPASAATPAPTEPIDISQLDLSQFGFNPTPAATPTPAPAEPIDINQLDPSQFGFNPSPPGTLSGGSLVQFSGAPETVSSRGQSFEETRYGIFDGQNYIRSPLAQREGNARFGFSGSDQVQVYEIDKSGKALLRNSPVYDQQDRKNAAQIPDALEFIKGTSGYTKGRPYYVVYDENNREFIFEKNLAVEAEGNSSDQTVPGKLVSVDRKLVSQANAEAQTGGLENQFESVPRGVFNDFGDFLNRVLLDPLTTDRSEAQTAVAKVANLADSLDTLLAAPGDQRIDLSRADYGAFQQLRSEGTVSVDRARLMVAQQLTQELESGKAGKLINDYSKDSARTGAVLKATAATAVGLAVGPAVAAAGLSGAAASAASGAFANSLVEAIEQSSRGNISYSKLVESAANGALLSATLDGLNVNHQALTGYFHDLLLSFSPNEPDPTSVDGLVQSYKALIGA